jgi:hypothetical protein
MLMDPQSFLPLPLSSLCPFLHLSSFFTHIGSPDQAFQPHATPVTPRHPKSGRGPQSATRRQRSVAAVRFRTDSEPEPNPNRTSVQFRQRQRTGPNPRCGLGFEDCWISPNLSEHVRTCANIKFSSLKITIFTKKKLCTRTVLASTEVS